MLKKLNTFEHRTKSKLDFAWVHLKELKEYKQKGSGNQFERAHEESYLFHLWGTVDAFLREINFMYECNLSPSKIRVKSLKKRVNELGRSSSELDELDRLLGDKESWFSLLNVMRNHSMHESNISRIFEVSIGGNKNKNEVRLRHPKKGNEEDIDSEVDVLELFESWYRKMKTLVHQLRDSARENCNVG